MDIKPLSLAISIAFAGLFAINPAASAQSLPAVQVQGQVSYVSGGVGEDEIAAFKQASADYPLQLQFVRRASPRDEFLSEVKVTIRGRSKDVLLDTVSKGPFFLAKLPAGTYQIEASYGGVMKRQTVDIRAGKRERAMFVWATTPGDASDSVVGQANDRQ